MLIGLWRSIMGRGAPYAGAAARAYTCREAALYAWSSRCGCGRRLKLSEVRRVGMLCVFRSSLDWTCTDVVQPYA